MKANLLLEHLQAQIDAFNALGTSKEYHDLKAKIKALKKQITSENDSNLTDQIEILETKINVFKPVVDQLLKSRIQAAKRVYALDRKLNKLTSNNLLLETNINQLEQLISDQDKLAIKHKQLNILNDDIANHKEIIRAKKAANEAYSLEMIHYLKLKDQLKLQTKQIKQIETLQLDAIKQKINDKTKKQQELKTKIDKQTQQISQLVNSLEIIDQILANNKTVENEFAFVVNNLNVFYGNKQALYDININIPKNKIISIIGPSGCGKSTFLKTLNRINDETPIFRAEGKILFDGEYDIYKLHSIKNKNDKMELTELRTKVGMIFQQPNPFPMSIYKNVVFGPKINGIKDKQILDDIAKNSLQDAALWDSVKDDLNRLATSLSGGQQQRLCIARAIANSPKILLMDEPTSALDPIAAAKIEELILKLKKEYTIIIVTHSMQQAARISDYTAFFYEGELIEFDKTSRIFSTPKEEKTDAYIRGKFG